MLLEPAVHVLPRFSKISGGIFTLSSGRLAEQAGYLIGDAVSPTANLGAAVAVNKTVFVLTRVATERVRFH